MGTNQALRSERFQAQLAFGQIAETDIARWLMTRGSVVLPIYDIEYSTGKGPRVFMLGGTLVAPDLLTFKGGKLTWIEAKHKSVFSWYRIGQRWETGIDHHHFLQYVEVQKALGIPVWLLFLHRQSKPDSKDQRFSCCPESCPVGLFGNSLDNLAKPRHSPKWGRHGMDYWAHGELIRLATLNEVQESARQA